MWGVIREFVVRLVTGKIKRNDIWCWCSGYYRWAVATTLPFLIRKHIREQLEWRFKKVNPVCKEQGSCLGCGCVYPQVVYCSKGCVLECYPKMLSRYEWERILGAE